MMERDAMMPALKTEEAALLPALPRQRWTGGAALKAALRKASLLDERRTGNAVTAGRMEKPASASAAQPPAPGCPACRAALRQALQGNQRKSNRRLESEE